MYTQALLTLLFLAAGGTRTATCVEEEPGEVPYQSESIAERFLSTVEGEERNVRGLADDRILSSLMRSIMHTPQRFGRNPSFMFQPQRFGREIRILSDRGENGQMQSRTWDTIPPQFWSKAIPQRFGKKK